VGVVATIVSIAVFIAASQVLSSEDPSALAVLLCGLLTVGAVIGAKILCEGAVVAVG
jgi:hypothetical protein